MTSDLQWLCDLPAPSTKGELLERIPPARGELLRTVTSLSPEDLSRPGHEVWAVKDHLAHLAAWQRMVIAHLTDGTDYRVADMEPSVYANASLDEINSRLYELHRDDTAEHVLREFDAAQVTMISLAGGLTNEQLAAPYWDDDVRTVIDKITGDTYRHDIEHLGWIEELLQRMRATA